MMPRGGDRAPSASFSRNTSLESSVIFNMTEASTEGRLTGTTVVVVGLSVSYLSVLLLDQHLRLLDVVVKLLDVAAIGLQF